MSTVEHIEAHELPIALIAVPPFPAVALKALRLISCHDPRLRELHDLIRADQTFSCEILRIANSPLFPFPPPSPALCRRSCCSAWNAYSHSPSLSACAPYLKDSLEVPVLKAC